MLLRSLFVVLSLASLSIAQRGGEGAVTEEEQLRRKQAALEAQDLGDVKEGKGGKEEELDNLTPEQRLARNIRHGATNFCRFVASAKPAKLMPGQSGTIVLTAVLQGDAVMPSPAPFEVTSTPAQGLATLGTAQFKPAAVGKIAKAYLGRPVYDNTADIEVPVTMAAAATIGQKQTVSIEMRFDLYDGNSAQTVGRFIDRASVEIEVGQAADPAVRFPERSDSGAVPDAGTGGEAATVAAEERPAAPAGQALGGAAPVVVDAPADPVAAPSAGAAQPGLGADGGEGSLGVPLMVGGGILLVGLIVLLVRRK
jgi:hypothetical protein